MCGDIVVAFTSPADGAEVGKTIAVTATAKNASGDPIDLASARIQSKGPGEADFGSATGGTVSLGGATFSSVTLPVGTNALKVTVVQKNPTCEGTRTITVVVKDDVPVEPPAVTSISFENDVEPLLTLNSMELPAGQAPVMNVQTTLADGCTLSIVDQAPPNDVRATAMIPTGGQVAVPLSFLSMMAETTQLLRATVACINPTRASDPNAPAANVTLTIDRNVPSCMIVSPTEPVVGPMADADMVKPGYQIRTAIMGTNATTLEIKLTGGAMPQTSGAQAPVMDGLAHDFDVPTTGTTVYTVTGEVKDTAGNVSTCSRSVTADFEAPVVVITSPTAAGSPYSSFAIPLTANVTDTTGGGTVTFAEGARQLGVATVPAMPGQQMVSTTNPGSFTGGMHTVTVTATDAAGNVSAPVSETFNIVATGCSVQFTRPAANPALISAANVTGGNYEVQVTTSCPNEMVTFSVNGMNPQTVAANSAGIATFTVPVTNGTYTWTATVGANSSTIDVTVSLTAPTITQPIAAMPNTRLNVSADLQRGTAGVQRQFSYSATVPTGGRVDVCVDSQAVAGAGAAACPDMAAGWYVLAANVPASNATFTFPDGTYQIKIVVVGGGNAVASVPFTLLVDSVLPSVASATFVNDVAPLNKLNAMELGANPPQLRVTLAGTDVQASIASIVVRQRGGSTLYNTAGAVSWAGNVATITLDQNVTATEASYDFEVVLVDQAGNNNVLNNGTAADPVNTAAILTGVRIDRVAPDCSIQQPSETLMGWPDDANPATPAFDLGVRVATSSDVSGMGVRLTLTGQSAVNVAPSAGVATYSFDLTAQGMTSQTYSLAVVCTDDAGNATNAAFNNFEVDLEKPTCAITAPTGAMNYASFSIATSVTVGGAGTVGRNVTVFSQKGAAQPVLAGTFTVSAGGVASGNGNYQDGTQLVTASIVDAAGNECVTPAVSINVLATGCPITMTSPLIRTSNPGSGKAFLNATDDTNPGTPTVADFVATGSTSCGSGKTVTLKQGASTLGSAMTDASGNVSIPAQLAEGGPYTLTMTIDNGAGILTDAELTPLFVDLTPPTVGTLTPGGTMALNFVAATNANLPAANYIQDTAAGAPANFTVSFGNVAGANGGDIRVIYGGTVVASQLINATPATGSLAATLAQGSTGTFSIEVRDEAGNAVRPTNTTATVDVEAPGAPTVTQTILDPRAGTVQLQWAPTQNDGATGGAHAGYDIRWTTAIVVNNNGLSTEADYAAIGTKVSQEPLVAWSANPITQTITLPPLNTYYLKVRARDAIGNLSEFGSAPAALANLGTTVQLTYPQAVNNQGFGRSLAANGSLNGDTIDDLVAGASTGNRAYVYFGSAAGFSSSVACPSAGCQVFTAPTTWTGNDLFGGAVAVGDVGGTNAPDLLIGAGAAATNTGRVFLYFGGANPIDTTVFIEFRGSATATGFGNAVSVLSDIDGDGIGEIAIGASGETANQGKLYIYKGRSVADWQALRTGNTSGVVFVPTTAANWVINGPLPVDGNVFAGVAGKLGITSIADLNGDGRREFTVAHTRDTTQRLWILDAATVAASSAAITLTSTGPAPHLTMTQGPYTGTTTGGFGVLAIGNVELGGSATLRDLVVSQPSQGKVHIFQDGTATGYGSPVTSISGSASFGTSGVPVDFNGDGRIDLALGEASTIGSTAWLFFNRTTGFDNSTTSGFWKASFPGTEIGRASAAGDFNGDTKIDFAFGDNGNAPGKVTVWQ